MASCFFVFLLAFVVVSAYRFIFTVLLFMIEGECVCVCGEGGGGLYVEDEWANWTDCICKT